MLRKILFAVLFLGAIAPAVADTECPMGWGYTTLVDASAGGCVDLGTLDWTESTNYPKVWSVSKTADMKEGYAGFCPRYKNVGAKGFGQLQEGEMCRGGSGMYIAIKDSNYTDAASFKQAMSGVILYYQRETDSIWLPPRDDTVCNINTSSYEPYGEYILPEMYGCTMCPPNTYKDTVGNTECTPCPDGTLSPAGAKSIDQCGHILHVGNYNIFMPVGRRTEHGLCTMLDGVKYCAELYEKE